MEAPSYYLPRPPLDLTPEKLAAFERLFQATPPGASIDYALPYPKWQFLTCLCESNELVLHGSQNQGIQQVEPRQARDIRGFSSQHAIYATTDGIWVIYFAILDRFKYRQMSLFNSCFQARISDEQLSDPLYFFSISQPVLLQKPWCRGTIYLLPRQPFQQEAPRQIQGMEIIFPHWVSSSVIKPLARLDVGPEDFPFLEQIHGHNDAKVVELASQNPDGPWLEALES